jgi:hypothetical protein
MWLQPATIPNHNIPQTNSWKEIFEGFQKLLFQEILQLFALGEIVFIGDFNSIELPESWYSFHVGGYNPIYN